MHVCPRLGDIPHEAFVFSGRNAAPVNAHIRQPFIIIVLADHAGNCDGGRKHSQVSPARVKADNLAGEWFAKGVLRPVNQICVANPDIALASVKFYVVGSRAEEGLRRRGRSALGRRIVASRRAGRKAQKKEERKCS